MARVDESKILKALKPRRIIYPMLIGMGVVAFFLYRDFNANPISFSKWIEETKEYRLWSGVPILYTIILFITIAFLMMAVRDIAYMWRIRVLTDHKLTWWKSFDVIVLWEFSSALSPPVIGGVGPAIFFLYKEGINAGKSTAIILVSILLDELFYITMVPILFFSLGYDSIFKVENINGYVFEYGLSFLLLIGYIVSFVYSAILCYAVFVNPYTIKSLLSWIFLIPGLRKWRLAVRKSGNQMIVASREMKNKNFSYWFKAVVSTFASWTGRFWVTNFMFMAFFASKLGYFDHFLIYARQLVMRMLFLVSPTPGASGIAEYVFSKFLIDLIPNLSWAVPLALIWRLITYYPYLFLGSIVLPGWIKRVYKKK
ncbi:MAG: lysylphosphatidylglycerol synthase transmembrane domain-containing protein [Bacteroidales bacterium]|nr:lysylphosphatidylglycerol synthase transmembrane domain-containing protein [Bacteroidales bacterium]